MVSDAIAKGNVQAINYFVAQRYVDALGKFADSNNQKTFFLPVDASSVIGAIGGIAEIARDSLGRKDGGTGGGSGGGSGGGRGPWGGNEG